jgi:hypothetical protein
MGPDGGFITGSDVLVDDGVTAAYWSAGLCPRPCLGWLAHGPSFPKSVASSSREGLALAVRGDLGDGIGCVLARGISVTWLTFLMVAVAVAAVFALVGAQPKGARPVAGTRLMAVGRVVLVIGIIIVAYLFLRR